MRLPFKKSKPSRRQRTGTQENSGSPRLVYFSNRQDIKGNTGRQEKRESRKPLPGVTRRFWLQRFGLLFLLVAVIICAFNIVIVSPKANVVTLQGSSTAFIHNKGAYQQAVNELIAGSFLNQNKITINTSAISQKLIKQFPELSKVNITLPLLSHTPVVYLTAAQPALILANSNDSFVIDTAGNALIETTHISNLANLNLPVVIDQSNLNTKLKEQALSSSNVSFIQTIVAQLAAKHISITSMTLPQATSELDVGIAGKPYFVKFNLESNDARQQSGTFLATQAHLQNQRITPSRYIDVRVDGRAYYQ